MQDLLLHNALRDSDLYNLLVMPLIKGDGTQPLTRDVFTSGIKRLGYAGMRIVHTWRTLVRA